MKKPARTAHPESEETDMKKPIFKLLRHGFCALLGAALLGVALYHLCTLM